MGYYNAPRFPTWTRLTVGGVVRPLLLLPLGLAPPRLSSPGRALALRAWDQDLLGKSGSLISALARLLDPLGLLVLSARIPREAGPGDALLPRHRPVESLRR